MVTAAVMRMCRFKRHSFQSKQNHLLGVMGIDVPIDEMTDLFPKHQLGLFGYPFAINTNGFVIFHPRLKDHIVYIEVIIANALHRIANEKYY